MPSRVFRQLWTEDTLGLSYRWNQELMFTFSSMLKSILVIPDASTAIVRSLSFIGDLHEGYVCIHIRRGDKLISEANPINVKKYLEKIPSSLNTLPLLVITDDFDSYLELDNVAKSITPSRRIYTTAPECAKGYDNTAHYRSPATERKNSLYLLLADFYLAINSTSFIGTYSSNFGRAIYLWRNGTNSHSVDGDFRFIY